MTITVRGTSTATGGDSFTIAKPAGVQEGDLLLLYLAHGASSTGRTFVKPAEFVVVEDYSGISDGCAVYAKVATASEPASYTVGATGSSNMAAGILALYGGLTITIDDSAKINSTLFVSAVDYPTLTQTTVSALLCAFTATRTGGTAMAATGSMSELWEFNTQANGQTNHLAVEYLTVNGDTPTRTIAFTPDDGYRIITLLVQEPIPPADLWITGAGVLVEGEPDPRARTTVAGALIEVDPAAKGLVSAAGALAEFGEIARALVSAQGILVETEPETAEAPDVGVTFGGVDITAYLNHSALIAEVAPWDCTVLSSEAAAAIATPGNWHLPVGGAWSPESDGVIGPLALQATVAALAVRFRNVTYAWSQALLTHYTVTSDHPASGLFWAATFTGDGVPLRSTTL
jgi:hypothetical protein